MSTDDEYMVDTEHTTPCPICRSFPHKLTCPNGEGVIKIPVTVGPEICRFTVLVKVALVGGLYRFADAQCERESGHIGFHVIPEVKES